MDREKLNEKALDRISNNENVLLEWATGTGKTYAALNAIRHIGGNWLIVLSEKQHMDNWAKEITKHGMEDILMQTDFVLYASLHKYKKSIYHGIILDEAHHAMTDKRIAILKTIKRQRTVLLTATFDEFEKMRFRTEFGSLLSIKISLKRAIELGFVPKPEIHLHKLTLSSSDRISYNKLTNKMNYWKNRYFHDREEWMKMRWLSHGSKRKKFLADKKTDYAKELIKNLGKRRFICFTGSINQSIEIGDINSVHSKKKGNQNVIDKFNKGEIDNIFATGMLKEGTNLNNIDVGIIIQLSSKLKDFIQMMGRSLRSKNVPEQHIIYFEGTQDEVYLNNVINEVKDYVKI